MYTKLQISGTIKLETGMHIGGSSDFSAIGAVDSPVVKDVITKLPMIPGSSLKGKLRYLLSRKYNDHIVNDHSSDGDAICRLFGSSEKDADGRINASRIQVCDMVLANYRALEKMGVSPTEVKFENTINRSTAIANPRQIERSVRDSEFEIDIIYNATNVKETLEDLTLLKEAFDLLQYDFIGGHGSRGYGRVSIEGLSLKVVAGDLDEEIERAAVAIIEGA